MKPDNNYYTVFISIFLTLSVIACFAVFIWKTQFNYIVYDRYKIIFNQASAYGICKGCPLFYRGYPVGHIKSIEFIEGNVIADAEIHNNNFPVNKSTKIHTMLLDLGGSYGLIIETKNLNSELLDDKVFYASLSTIEEIINSLDKFNNYIKNFENENKEKVQDLIVNINYVFTKINNLFDDAQVKTISNKLENLLNNLILLSKKARKSTILKF